MNVVMIQHSSMPKKNLSLITKYRNNVGPKEGRKSKELVRIMRMKMTYSSEECKRSNHHRWSIMEEESFYNSGSEGHGTNGGQEASDQ